MQRLPDVTLRRSFTRPSTALGDRRPGNEAIGLLSESVQVSFPDLKSTFITSDKKRYSKRRAVVNKILKWSLKFTLSLLHLLFPLVKDFQHLSVPGRLWASLLPVPRVSASHLQTKMFNKQSQHYVTDWVNRTMFDKTNKLHFGLEMENEASREE